MMSSLEKKYILTIRCTAQEMSGEIDARIRRTTDWNLCPTARGLIKCSTTKEKERESNQ
jgi:hypothetical protein